MGEETTLSVNDKPRIITVKAEGTAPIVKIEIIRNNEVVHTYKKRDLSAEFQWEDDKPLNQIALSSTYNGDAPFVFYYCRLTQENGQMAWSSPVWIAI